MVTILDINKLVGSSGLIYVSEPPTNEGVYKAAIVISDTQIIKEVFVNYNPSLKKANVIIEKNTLWRPLKQGLTSIYFEETHKPQDYGRQDLSSKQEF